MFKDKLRQLRIKKGYSMDKLVELYNKRFGGKLNKSTVSRYENGLQEPMFTVVKNFSELFNVSTDYLTDNEVENISSLSFTTKKEQQILSIFTMLNEEKQNKVIDYATAQLTDQEGEYFIAHNAAFGGASSAAVHTKESLTNLVSAINKENNNME